MNKSVDICPLLMMATRLSGRTYINHWNTKCIGESCMWYWKCKKPKTVDEVREEIFGDKK